ncbi:NRDE family protein [Vibrio cholerae]
MCSVTWSLSDTGYQVFFNRDEQRSRALALPPAIYDRQGVAVMMPLDPQGQGSWISLNQFGLSLCLLNNYQDRVPDGTLISRGLLLKSLAGSSSIEQITLAFEKLALSCFAPFTLLAFAPLLTQQHGEVLAYAWDGEQFCSGVTSSPLFSSGVALAEVQRYRTQVYQHLTADGVTPEKLLAFHCHQHPQWSHLSVAMQRDDAHTVSFTHIKVSDGQLGMSYLSGRPTQLTEQILHQPQYPFPQIISLVS